MNELATVLVEKKLLTIDIWEMWQNRLTQQIGPDGEAHAFTPWDPWLNHEWRLKPRTTLDEIRDYYDSDCHVVFQDLIGGGWGHGLQPELKDVELRGARVLDFGCGSGHDGRSCIDAGAHVSFADTSPRLLAGVRGMCERRGIATETYDDTSVLPEATFDLVICCDVFEHVLDPPALLHRLVSLIRPGGHLLQKTFFGSHELSPYHLDANMKYGPEWDALTRAEGLRLLRLAEGCLYDGLWQKPA